MKSARRVARPRSTGSTPVANGSSVPAWPTRRWPARRRTRATTSCEVQPLGLSMLRMPTSSGAAVTRAFPLLFDAAHQAHDAIAPRQRPIEYELEVRCVAQVQALFQVV